MCSYQDADSKSLLLVVDASSGGTSLEFDYSRDPAAEAVRLVQAFTLQYGDLTATNVGTSGGGAQAGVAQGTITIQAGSSSQVTTDQAYNCSAILVFGNFGVLFIMAYVQGRPAPSTAALQAQAKTSLGRLP
jgi:ABC-type phosphate transport system substrate-binding protein